MQSRIRIGMIGSGKISESHRVAMRLDDRYELVAGVFSRDQEKSKSIASGLRIHPDRVYADSHSMAAAEAALDKGIEAVSIVTPHDSHHEIATAFLDRGIHVICDKPLTITIEDALDLHGRVAKSGLVFGLTHNYSAYPMIRHARKLIRDGAIGEVRLVIVQHAQGRHAQMPQAGQSMPWRLDPGTATAESVVYDLGTHAHHLLRFVTGLEVEQVSAELTTHVPGHRVFDNLFATLRLSGGASGTLWASIIAAGNEHGLAIRVIGERGCLEWQHEDATHLVCRAIDGTATTVSAAQPGISQEALAVSRLPWGHPEGFFECFANLYREVADAIELHRGGKQPAAVDFPTTRDGVMGVRFVDAVRDSSRQEGAWTGISNEI